MRPVRSDSWCPLCSLWLSSLWRPNLFFHKNPRAMTIFVMVLAVSSWSTPIKTRSRALAMKTASRPPLRRLLLLDRMLRDNGYPNAHTAAAELEVNPFQCQSQRKLAIHPYRVPPALMPSASCTRFFAYNRSLPWLCYRERAEKKLSPGATWHERRESRSVSWRRRQRRGQHGRHFTWNPA
jgi:hypothetical protein